MKQRTILLLFFAIIGTSILHVWSLIRFPAIFVDEIWQMSRAWGFLQTGQTFGMLDSGVADRYPGYWTFLPWLGNVIQAIPLWINGAPSIFGLRLVSLLFGGLLLLAIFVITRKISGPLAAWIALFTIAYSHSFWIASHWARYDIIIAALGFSSIALYFIDQDHPRWWIRILCGLIGALVIEIHAFGMIFIFPIIALYAWKYRWGIIKSREAWQVLCGGILGIAFYVFMHILPYPESYFALNKLFFGESHTIPLLTFSPSIIFREIKHTIQIVITSSSFMCILVLISILGIFIKRTFGMKIWIILFLSIGSAFILLLPNKFFYYYILIMPVIYMGIGIFISWFWNEFSDSIKIQHKYIIIMIILSIQITSSMKFMQHLSINYYSVYQDAQTKINSHIQQNDKILSSQIYWYGLSDHKYYIWEQIIYYRRYKPGASIRDVMNDFRPDVIIIDKQMASAISDIPKSTAFAEALRIPEAELQRFLDTHGTFITTIENQIYGPIKVYRINWEDEESFVKESIPILCL